MKLPKIKDLQVANKKVLVRADLDTGESVKAGKERLEKLIPTIDLLASKDAKIVIIGHRGRPGGKVVEDLSLEAVSKYFEKLLQKTMGEKRVSKLDLQMMENLRFNPGEEANDVHFAQHLAHDADFYVNEAFAVSQREHASIVALPRALKSRNRNSVAAGIHFNQETESLNKVLVNPKPPVVVVIGGVKKDKINYLEEFTKIADKVLLGGRLPEYLGEDFGNKDIIVGRLIPDKEDITINSIEVFEKEIKKAGTIVVNGPMGKYEDRGHRQGTERVYTAVAQSPAYKVAGGGETLHTLSLLGLEDKFDWVSVGGGAMLEFLTKGTLPGIEALIN